MILMNDFKKSSLERREKQLQSVKRVMESGWYILGTEVEKFEKKFAHYVGIEHAIGVANGMDAIEIGLRALNIGPGDEVITTPMTAFATTLAILRAGAVPVLADIDLGTGQIDLSSASQCISPKTVALLYVHLYGQILDQSPILDFCRTAKIKYIEDCAQAHGAKWNGKHAGRFGEFGAFSFYPTKNLGCYGDGGAIVSRDKNFAQICSQLRNYGQSERYHHPLVGLNSRLDEMQAALLDINLDYLDEENSARKKIANRYHTEIKSSKITKLKAPAHEENHVYHLYSLRTKNREALVAHLKSAQIQSHSHYPIPIHKQASVKGIRCAPKGLDCAEIFASECLSLPCHPYMTEEEISCVIECVNSF